MKKSQVSIFVIIGIVILLVVLLLLLLNRNHIELIRGDSDKIQVFSKCVEETKAYSDECLKSVTMKAVNKYGVNDKEEEITNYIDKYIMECFDEIKLLEKQCGQINYSDPVPNVEIGNDLVISIIDLNLEIKKEEQRAFFGNISYQLKLPDDFKDPLAEFEELERGIYLKEDDKSKLRPLNIFIVKIDLDDPDVQFYVTEHIAPATMTTSEFLSRNKMDVAINGGGFDMGETNEVNVYAASDGIPYSAPEIKPGVTFFVTENNEVSIGQKIPENMKYAITGFTTVVRDGEVNEKLYQGNEKYEADYDNLKPRTSIGIDKEYKWVILIVVDGDPAGTIGITLKELGELHMEYGSYDAISMDGGGSTTLAIDENGAPKTVNTPSGGGERAVANHLGATGKPKIISK